MAKAACGIDVSCIVGDIQPASFRLSGQDALLSLLNHPLVHFYANNNRDSDFMPTKRLLKSLVLALKEFPILLGHVRQAGSGLDSVEVSGNCINKPVFTESFSSVHFSDLLSAHFDWAMWPDAVASAGASVTPSSDGKVKLLSVHLTRLADNSGAILFCNIPHYIVDGFGYYEFLNRWACICRDHRSHANASDGAQTPSTSKRPLFVFDRESWLKSLQLQHQPRPPGPLAKAIFEKDSAASRLLAWLSYTSRLRIASIGMRLKYGLARWFWVSAESVDHLLKLAIDDPACHLPKHEISTYSLVTALVDTAFVRAQRQMAKKRSPMSRAVSFVGSAFVRLFGGHVTGEHVLVNMVHVRHHLQPLAGFYFGNPVLIHPMSMSTTPAANTDARSSFVRQALAISEELRGIDGPSARGFVDMVCADPSAHARFATFAFTAPSILTVVDERSYRMDGVDFGNGGPVWISGIPIHMPNVVALLQQPAPMHGGVAIFASLEPGIAELIASDPFFNQFSSTM